MNIGYTQLGFDANKVMERALELDKEAEKPRYVLAAALLLGQRFDFVDFVNPMEAFPEEDFTEEEKEDYADLPESSYGEEEFVAGVDSNGETFDAVILGSVVWLSEEYIRYAAKGIYNLLSEEYIGFSTTDERLQSFDDLTEEFFAENTIEPSEWRILFQYEEFAEEFIPTLLA